LEKASKQAMITQNTIYFGNLSSKESIILKIQKRRKNKYNNKIGTKMHIFLYCSGQSIPELVFYNLTLDLLNRETDVGEIRAPLSLNLRQFPLKSKISTSFVHRNDLA
jgi:hypothetical protein